MAIRQQITAETRSFPGSIRVKMLSELHPPRLVRLQPASPAINEPQECAGTATCGNPLSTSAQTSLSIRAKLTDVSAEANRSHGTIR
jgi:hypothetical protein